LAHITNRRIQRLGSSSLIITIPKNWASRLGLSPGDNVIIVDEGDSLRVLPSNSGILNERRMTLRLRIKNLEEESFVETIRCAYTKGFTYVIIEHDSHLNLDLDRIRGTLQDLGVEEVLESEGGIVVKLPEISRDELSLALKRLSSTIQMILEKMENGEGNVERLFASLDILVMDVTRIMSSSDIRHDSQRHLERSLAVLLQLLADYVKELYKTAENTGNRLDGETLSKLRGVVSDILGGIAVGSLKRVTQAKELLDGLRERVNQMDEAPTKSMLNTVLILLERIVETSMCHLNIAE